MTRENLVTMSVRVDSRTYGWIYNRAKLHRRRVSAEVREILDRARRAAVRKEVKP